jgi:hypothetical protein
MERSTATPFFIRQSNSPQWDKCPEKRVATMVYIGLGYAGQRVGGRPSLPQRGLAEAGPVAFGSARFEGYVGYTRGFAGEAVGR